MPDLSKFLRLMAADLVRASAPLQASGIDVNHLTRIAVELTNKAVELEDPAYIAALRSRTFLDSRDT